MTSKKPLDLDALRERADGYRATPESTAEIFYASDVSALLDAIAFRNEWIKRVHAWKNDPKSGEMFEQILADSPETRGEEAG